MSRRGLFYIAVLVWLVLLGMRCGNGNPVLVIVAPQEGAVEDSCGVELQVHARGTVDIATLAATLNGVPVALAPDPQTAMLYTAVVGPGAPLAANNLLEVSADVVGGGNLQTDQANFDFTGDRARGREIVDPADLMQGPLAHGQLGDYLLENCVARFIVQDATPLAPGGLSDRDLYSVGGFGGNLIDAELVANPGTDNFLEIQPVSNIETVFNAQTVELLNDGVDGNPAIVRACGPDDLLDFINPSSNVAEFGFSLPAVADDTDNDVMGCTEFSLDADQDYVTMTTTVTNNEAGDLPLFIGDFMNAAGEVDPWAAAGGGIGSVLVATHRSFSYIGFGDNSGVDYGYVTEPRPDSVLATSDSLTVAGVTAVLHHNSIVLTVLGTPSNFVVPGGGGTNSYTRYLAVGDGSGANAVGLSLVQGSLPRADLSGCVTVGGAPAPGARVAVATLPAGQVGNVVAHFVVGDDGCYAGTIPPGTYGVTAGRVGTPYEGGGSTPFFHPLTIADGASMVQDIALPATGGLSVSVVDDSGAPIPARVTVVGFDPSPDVSISFSQAPGIIPPSGTQLFNDENWGSFAIVRAAYAGADGLAAFDVEPGSYQVYVSRGPEYSLFQQPATVAAGAPQPVAATLARVLDTTGFISSDYHVHGLRSADSNVGQRNRVMQFAGEGVDNIIMTEHHAHNDLDPTIGGLGLQDQVASTIGEEITTWDYGHFNGYPFLTDPTRQSQGSTDWAGKAPPGKDFPSAGSYIKPPAGLYAEATGGALATPDTVVQVNHIDSHFAPLKLDTSVAPPQTNLSVGELTAARLDPALAGQNLFHLFDALEVWNGASSGAQSQFRDDRIGVWFNLLNQGMPITALASTDTHGFFNLAAGGARTWTPSSNEAPLLISDAEIGQAVAAGKAAGGQGLYVQAELIDLADVSNTADFSLGGSTEVRAPGGQVRLRIDVQAPIWSGYDRIEVYRNAFTTVAQTATLDASLGGGTVPVLFGAVADDVLDLGTDFTQTTVNVVPAVAGAERIESTVEIDYTLTEDTWFVVLVRGRNGVSVPLFPVHPSSLDSGSNPTLADLIDGNLGEGGTRALGFTNALYADVDAEVGFQAPGPRVVP